MIPLNGPFALLGFPKFSYRSPRFSVKVDVGFQLSCTNSDHSFVRYSPTATVERPVAGSTARVSEYGSSSTKSRK